MKRTAVVVGNARDRAFHVPKHGGGREGSSPLESSTILRVLRNRASLHHLDTRASCFYFSIRRRSARIQVEVNSNGDDRWTIVHLPK